MKKNIFTSRLLNQPLALSQPYIDTINTRIAAGTIESFLNMPPQEKEDCPENYLSVIRVFDILTSKDSWGTSYVNLTSRVNRLVEEGVKQIFFYIDSPGGEVAGLFGFSNFIKSLPETHGVETIAVTDGSMTSAAYVVGAACQKVLATESSIIGSIGMLMTLANVYKAEKAAGVEYTILRSKSEKALINPHEPVSKEGVEDAEKMLSSLDEIMNTTVLSYRSNVSLDTIVGLKGNTVLAKEALSLGLIDGIVSSFDEAISLTAPATKITKPKGVSMSMTLEQALLKLNAVESELQTLKASTSLEVAKAKQQEQGRVLGILEAATTFKLPTALAMKRISAGTSIEETVDMFEGIKEGIQASNAVDTTSASLVASSAPVIALASPAQEVSFLTSFMKGVDTIDASENLYKGVK